MATRSLQDRYNTRSFTRALASAAQAVAVAPQPPQTTAPASSPQPPQTTAPAPAPAPPQSNTHHTPPLADTWLRVASRLPTERQQELLTGARAAVNTMRAPGLDKARVLAELTEELFKAGGDGTISPTAKFFLLRAAVGEDKFVFRHGNWSYPATRPSRGGTRRTVVREDGSVGLEPNVEDKVPTDNPWRPVRGRSAYRKPELVLLLQRITGTPVDRTLKTDALYARLSGLVLPLSQN
jgi:hypothetical protein